MQAAQPAIVCPQCGSTRVYHDGFRPAPLNAASPEPLQRYRCADYGHRWSEKAVLNTSPAYSNGSHVGAKKAKNMVPVQVEKTCAEMVEKPTAAEIKATLQIEKLLAQLRNDGKTAATIRNYKVYLTLLLNHDADLYDPENTKAVLAALPLAKATKKLVTGILKTWYDFNAIHWKPPNYQRDSAIPYIPTEAELDQLIAGLGKKTATFCQLLKDTGARSGEIAQLTWNDIDFNQKTVNIRAEKRSNGRILPLTAKTIDMLSNLPRKKQKIFADANSIRAHYYTQRRRIAEKIANPNLLKIHFHTFRHWKATHELHLTHDRERVQIILGHKSANTTETYIHINKMLYLTQTSGAFTVKVADTLEEAIKLMEAGYEYHTEIEGHKLFRRRK